LETLINNAAKHLANSGAKFVVICSNTGHKAVGGLPRAVPELPLLHIVDCCVHVVKKKIGKQKAKIGLIGTFYTMSQSFLKEQYEAHGHEIILPPIENWKKIQAVILEELSRNIVNDNSSLIMYQSIHSMIDNGAECIVLGCTEIPMLVKEEEILYNSKKIPVIDSGKAHIYAAVDIYLGLANIENFFPSKY